MKKILAATALVLILSACSTTQTPMSEAKPVPADRLLAFQEKTNATTATMIVTRDQGMIASACYLGFSINDVLAARLDVAETATFYLTPGEYVLKYDIDPLGHGLCSLGQGMSKSRETILKKTETKYFRTTFSANGELDIQRSEKE